MSVMSASKTLPAVALAGVGALTVSAAAALSLFGAAGAARAADPAHPVVVERFQSQGCSSCPPANANFVPLTDRPDVLALSWQVTYWDDLGWKDTFASPAFTARQWDYAHAFHRGQVATPEVIVNGKFDVVGARKGEIEELIRRADRGPGGPRVDFAGDKVTVTGQGKGEVVLVRYDPTIVQVPIKAGENGGRTLPHKNVVREVVHLGAWNGQTQSFTLPAARLSGLKTAVLVQAGVGGPILAAGRA